MGDMADYFLEQVEDEECARAEYLHGFLADEQAIDRGLLDEHGFLQNASSGGRTCRCCGRRGLQWGKMCGKFRLFDGNNIHQCSVNPLRETEGGGAMSGEINDGGQAFPFRDADGEGGSMTFPGMTPRDYFAAAAMQGMLAASWGNPMDCQRLAHDSYRVADAMLAARERKEESK